jgi:hypothetical protein
LERLDSLVPRRGCNGPGNRSAPPQENAEHFARDRLL